MSRKVKGQTLLDATNRCNLFEVVVTLLIGGYQEQSVVAVTTSHARNISLYLAKIKLRRLSR